MISRISIVQVPFSAQSQPFSEALGGYRQLLFEHFLDLPDFLLDGPRKLFILAFSLEIGIVGHLSGLLLEFALGLVNLALHLIFCAGFHNSPFWTFDSIGAEISR